jgi:nucleoside phosphorylase
MTTPKSADVRALADAAKQWHLVPTAESTKGPTQVIGDERDLAIICALKDPELDQVFAAFGGEWPMLPRSIDDPHRYFGADVELGSRATIRVVAAAPNHMGMVSSAVLATKMILRFRPRLIVMAGIAGGTAGDDIGFGDILVADQTVDYGSGKLTAKDGQRVLKPSPNPLPVDPTILALLRNRGSTEADCHSIISSWPANRPRTALRVHIGTFGTNDVVVDDESTVAEVTDRWRKLVAVEMETHAVHRACVENRVPAPKFIAVKSASDLASNKSDQWRKCGLYVSRIRCAFGSRGLGTSRSLTLSRQLPVYTFNSYAT